VVYQAVVGMGLDRVGRRGCAGKLVVLTYHRFSRAGEGGLHDFLSAERFVEQLLWLRREFEVVSLEEGVKRLARAEGDFRRRPLVAVTIDDGFRDVYEVAAPILRAAAVPFTVFVVTDFASNGRPPWPSYLCDMVERRTVDKLQWPFAVEFRSRAQVARGLRVLKLWWAKQAPTDRIAALQEIRRQLKPDGQGDLRPMTWRQLQELARAGATIGSHTVFHNRLTDLDEEEAMNELLNSRKEIEANIGDPVSTLAYPDGAWNDKVVRLARQAGYALAVTQDRGPNTARTCALTLRRIQVPGGETFATFVCRASLIAV
jgi:peptidoglycan/xylan/chitin deacetylase (PgdA/CDA1 family)